LKKETIKISGMSCNHCVMRVTDALKGLDGVKDASVSLDDGGKAVVSYDEARLDKAKITEAISEAGYTPEG
jgi:copper ion binding protein